MPIACANAQYPAQTTTPQTFQSTTQNKAACLYFAIREFDTLYTNSVLVIAMKKKRQIWSSSRLAASDGNKDAPTTWTKQNVFSLFNCNVFIPNIMPNISRLKLLSCMQLICNIRALTQFILEMLFLLGVVMRQCAHGLNRGVVPYAFRFLSISALLTVFWIRTEIIFFSLKDVECQLIAY